MNYDGRVLSRRNIVRACMYALLFLVTFELSIYFSVHIKTTYELARRYNFFNFNISRYTVNLNSSDECDWISNSSIRDSKRDDKCKSAWTCPVSPSGLVGPLGTYTEAPPHEELIRLYPLVQPGGRYTPNECISRERVAIIIPFRDREEHLRILLHNLHPMLQRQQLDYGIYVIDQINGTQFNRGMLMNIGYMESVKLYNYTCFVFHDVDLIPENDRIMYDCNGSPRHLSGAVDKFKYELPYVTLFGGVTSIKRKHFEDVNGYSNKFFGWGGEDDDMFRRLVHHGFQISRYQMALSRYKMMKHRKDAGNKVNKRRHHLIKTGKRRYKRDGINKLLYERLGIEYRLLYTRIIVSINESLVMRN